MRGLTDPADFFTVGDIDTDTFRKRFPDGLYSREMIAHYSTSMRGVAYWRVGEIEAARELVQESWLTFSRDYKAGKHHLNVPIRAILLNLVNCVSKESFKKRKKAQERISTTSAFTDLDLLPNRGPDPSQEADHQLQLERILEWIHKSNNLSSLERYVLMRTCYGKTPKDIANELKMQRNDVSKIKHRATKKLKARLDGRPGNGG